MTRISWPPVIERSAEIVREYNTPVTLRQVFYRLVSEGAIPNTEPAYKRLSSLTAEARREGTHPPFADNTREIYRPGSFESPEEARRWLADAYRRDRTEGQPYTIFVASEKSTMVAQLQSWFGEHGIPVVALRGYGSQTYVDEIAEDVKAQDRPAKIIYAGDFDPSGMDIERDLRDRLSGAAEVHRIAVLPEHPEEYGLKENPGKESDSRSEGFIEEHGKLVQVEIEAMEPGTLRTLYEQKLDRYWDKSTFDDVLARERDERGSL